MTEEKLSATKLARKHNTSTAEIQRQLICRGYIEERGGLHFFTDLGKSVGGEWRKVSDPNNGYDGHMVWPADLLLRTQPSAAKGAVMQFNKHNADALETLRKARPALFDVAAAELGTVLHKPGNA